MMQLSGKALAWYVSKILSEAEICEGERDGHREKEHINRLYEHGYAKIVEDLQKWVDSGPMYPTKIELGTCRMLESTNINQQH